MTFSIPEPVLWMAAGWIGGGIIKTVINFIRAFDRATNN